MQLHISKYHMYVTLLSSFIIFCACTKDDILIEEPPSATLEDYPAEMRAFLASFSSFHRAWQDQTAIYEAWPLGQLWYDPSNEKVCQVYNAREKHEDLHHGNVLFRNKNERGEWSDPIVVALWNSDNSSKRCHGAGVCPNGDYIALVLHEDRDKSYGNVYVYRSQDKGVEWFNEGPILIDGKTIYVSESTCLFKTSTNRLLSYASVGLGHSQACVIYSDDNGVSWKKTMMPNGMGFMECTFVEMDNHDIYCIARQQDYYCYPNSPQMAHSEDNGSTWVYDGDTGICSTDAPVSQIKVGNNIYLLYGERWPYQRGKLTLRFNWLSTEEYHNMQFRKREIVLSEINSEVPDFSYPALVETPNTIQGTFYCRDGKWVSIFEMIANKPIYN